MKINKHIYTLLTLLLTLVGCSKEPFGGGLSDGQVRLAVELLNNYSSEVVETRAGDADIATSREKALENGTVFVFESSGGKLQQTALLQKDTETGGYYAILEASTVAVKVKAVANYDLSSVQSKIDDKSLVVEDLVNNTYTTSNKVLKNLADNTGLLPKSSQVLSLSAINATQVEGKKLEIDFDYARIDVLLPLNGQEYPKILEVTALNAPALPLSSTKISETHSVTPTTNLSPYPSAISTEVAANKYVQGIYVYPTHTNFVFTDENAVSLLLKVQKSSELGATYYKIKFRYSLGTAFAYDLRRDYRYLLKINSLTSEGYSTKQEALDAPAANLDYNIVIDENSTHIVSNGQYYIGASKKEYWATSFKSNMLFTNPILMGITNKNDESWSYNSATDTYSVDISFTLGDGDGGRIFPNLSHSLTLPDGVTFDATTPLPEEWNTIETTQEYKLNIASGFTQGDIIIKLGELTQKIWLSVDAGIVTDYTDYEVVNEITGLFENKDLRVANSYIVSPFAGEEVRVFIPVCDRVNEFWNDYATSPVADYTIPQERWFDNDEFQVQTSWYDGANLTGLKVEKGYSAKSSQNAIVVTIPSELKHQNIVLNLLKNGTIIWSWHLWVTDYNPYVVSLKETDNDFVSYPKRTSTDQVENVLEGELHSYTGTLWSGAGIYTDKFIMDRNIGARNTTFEGQNGDDPNTGGALYYQFGRKDPFPGSAGKYVNSINDIEDYQMSYATAVNNPTLFIALGNNWSNETSAQGINIIWNDKKITSSSYAVGKSIFDPSPLGFRVPIIGVFSNFNNTTFPGSSNPTNPGHTYNGFVYFPTSGTLDATTKTLNYSRSRGYLWYALAKDSENAVYLGMYTGSMNVQASYFRTAGLPIRPVQE